MSERKDARSQINVRVPENFNAKMKLAAALAGVTASEFTRRAIVRALTEALSGNNAATSPHQHR